MAPEHLQRIRLLDDARIIELLHSPLTSQGADQGPRMWRRATWDRESVHPWGGEPVAVPDAQVSPDGRLRVRPRTWDGVDLVDEATGAVGLRHSETVHRIGGGSVR